MSDSKTKTSITVANAPTDLVVQSLLLFLQVVALILIACLVMNGAWTYGVILGVLSLSILYFGATLVYRLYRARLTFVRIKRSEISFFIGFKRRTVAADDLAVSHVETDKPSKKHKYGYVFDKNNERDGFIFAVDVKSSLGKLKDFAPHALLVFLIMCTDEEALRAIDCGGSDELSELIANELACREQARAEEAKSRKKKKRR